MCSCDNHLVLISSKETYMFNFKENIWIFNTNIHFYDYK